MLTSPSSQRLDLLPPPADLESLTRALATLDALMCADWEYRRYSFQNSWDSERGERMASVRNGSGDFWFIVFSSGGAFMKGFAHESNVASLRARAALTEGLPNAFARSAEEPAFMMDDTTFVFWNTGAGWARAALDLPEGPDPDGSEHLMELLGGDPNDYVRFAGDYFERDVPLAAVRAIYDGEPLTEQLLGDLGSERTLEQLRPDLIEIGYPVDEK